MKDKKRINPISKDPRKRAKRFVPDSVIKAVKNRSGGLCERVLMAYTRINMEEGLLRRGPCGKPSMKQPHHRLARSQGGEHTKENLVDLCFECHRWVHENPKKAIVEGLTIPYHGYVHVHELKRET